MVSYSSGTVVPPNTAVLGTGENRRYSETAVLRGRTLKGPIWDLKWAAVLGVRLYCCIGRAVLGGKTVIIILWVPQAVKHCKLYLKLYFHASLDTVKLCNLTIKLPTRSQWYCDVWGLLWNICDYNIIFLIAILSITRTISVLFPFLDVR